RAAIVISEMIRYPDKWKNKITSKTKQEMFEEIFRRYNLLQARMPGSSIIEIATIVVHQPAPKFYFTPRTIGEFVSRIKNGYYKHKPSR
ncbi:MAG: hypothetical protein K2L89_05995, partial [Muribaculaceae bacterium]|nr:hypothetical protein [Muribaculaceae bacterium]